MRSRMLRMLRLSWPAIATGIIVLGLLSAGVRLTLPSLAAKRPAIERWASERLQVPVALDSVGARWPGLLPHLELRGLRVAPTGDGGAAITCERVEFTLAVLDSLRAGEPVLKSIVLHGLRLGAERTADGRIGVTGLPASNPLFLAWLLRQERVEAWNSRLEYRDDASAEAPLVVETPDLRLHEDAGTRVLRGRLNGTGLLGENAHFELRWPTAAAPGPLHDGELRLAVQGAPLARLAQVLGRGPTLAQPFERADGRVWLRWAGGKAARIAADLKLARTQGARVPGFEMVHLRGVASRQAGGWAARLDTLAPGPSLGDGSTHPLAVTLTAERLYLQAEALPLDLLALLPPMPGVPELSGVSGQVMDLQAGLQRGSSAARYHVTGQLAHGAWAQRGALPGVEGLSGRFSANTSGGALDLAPGSLGIEHVERLVERLSLQVVLGRVEWNRGDQDSTLRIPSFEGSLQGLPLRLEGAVVHRSEAGLRVDLDVELGPGALAPLQTLLPAGLLPSRGERWFRNAFEGGRLEGLAFGLHGRLADFPFEDGEGSFALDFAVTDTRLRYSDRWPAAREVSGHGGLRGRTFEAVLSAARFADSPSDDIHLRIPDVLGREPRLAATGRIHTTLDDVRATLDDSPLRDSLGRQLQGFEIEDGFDLLLDLDLGLRRDARRTASGSVFFNGNRLASPRETLALDNVSGQVDFSGHQWQGKDLAARFDDMPVTLEAAGGGAGALATLRLRGTAQGVDLASLLARRVPGVHRWLQAAGKLGAFSGATPWQASLTLPLSAAPGAAGQDRTLVVDSSLEGLAIDLPWPLGKPADARLPFHLETRFPPQAPHLTRLSLGEGVQLSIQQTAASAGGALQGLDVALGRDEPAREPGGGIVLHGRARELPLGAWRALFPNGGSPALALPFSFDLQVDDLAVLGQRLAGTRLQGTHRDGRWQVTLDSARAAGKLVLDLGVNEPRLVLEMARLWLSPFGDAAGADRVDPRALPTLSLRCASFRYGEIDFGEAVLESARVAGGQQLERVLFRNPAFELDGRGSWLLEGGRQASELSLQLKGAALGTVLGTFGYAAAAIEGGRARLDIEASWPGMPSEFRLASLTGTLGLHVEEGRILSIEPGSGRLFGLLSLQELPRRLSFDFNDLFAKGFAFDRIEGWFKLEQGNAYTNSLYMEGPSAKVEVSGRTGLLAQDYDQRAIVTPALSASLPIAGALFGPAGVGVGAALYLGQQVFKEVPEQVDRFLRKEYAISGSWREPKVEKR